MTRTLTRLALLASAACSFPALAAPTPEQVALAALKAAPVMDAHNDVPEQLRDRRKDVLGVPGQPGAFDFRDTTNTADAAAGLAPMMTDLARIRKGHLGAQIWSVYVSAGLTDQQAVQATLEQIDVMKRVIAQNPRDMQLCGTAACVEGAMKAGRVGSMLGMEGGHSIGGSLGVLRQMYELGARYMTLTHFKNTPWADSATDAPLHGGLTDFGRTVVKEMQRIGMLVDLAHVSADTMRDALEVARAPVIVSHSNARAINSHPRNVPDDVLDLIKTNGGIVMVNFYPSYVVEATRQWDASKAAEKARQDALNRGDPKAAASALDAWVKANPMPIGSVADVADHLDYIKKRIGADHVGLGGDIDGIEVAVKGMEDVSGYPALFTELARRGWSQAELEKLSDRNILRVLKAAEAFAAAHKADPPYESATTF
ncbi:dipeptidase [Parablastomonas sp. CN1-191]|uniref:dipeptidase n=1 Tax=Parablastomonas sp. CN1-191 TaxID=3400908 RepID=UPI003BF7ED68